MNIKIEKIVTTPRLLSRAEILKTEGVYADPSCPHIRFVVNYNSECFVFGDTCKLYKSRNFDITNPRYVKVDEDIVFREHE